MRDPETPEPLRDGLELVMRARDFAGEIGFEVKGLYGQYAPWPGDEIVTHVVATRPGEIEAAGFWFPVVGELPYKGYFDAAAATREAERLRAEGYDVCLTPVRAYSTLGWFDDPVTGPMLRLPPPRLVETIFHELVHANLFFSGQATFNESAATFLGEEVRVAFYARDEGREGERRERARVEANRHLRREVEDLRLAVGRLYAESDAGSQRRADRQALEARARVRIAQLQLPEVPPDLAQRIRLNDACLALAGTYAADEEPLALALRAEGGDLSGLLRRLQALSSSEDPSADLLAGAQDEFLQGTP